MGISWNWQWTVQWSQPGLRQRKPLHDRKRRRPCPKVRMQPGYGHVLANDYWQSHSNQHPARYSLDHTHLLNLPDPHDHENLYLYVNANQNLHTVANLQCDPDH